MTERVRRVAERIRQELGAIDRVVRRAGRAMTVARERPEDQDVYLDSVALCLHDFYTGMERIFQQVAYRAPTRRMSRGGAQDACAERLAQWRPSEIRSDVPQNG